MPTLIAWPWSLILAALIVGAVVATCPPAAGPGAGLPRRGESSSLLALRKAVPVRRATVCLFSFHPLLLSEFQRLLTGENEARVLDRRVEANQVPEPSLAVPRASVYVLEAHSQRQVTEAFVTAILARFP